MRTSPCNGRIRANLFDCRGQTPPPQRGKNIDLSEEGSLHTFILLIKADEHRMVVVRIVQVGMLVLYAIGATHGTNAGVSSMK
jgi:hypothetical protein